MEQEETTILSQEVTILMNIERMEEVKLEIPIEEGKLKIKEKEYKKTVRIFD